MHTARLKRVLDHRLLRGVSLLTCALVGGAAARALELGLAAAFAIAAVAAVLLALGYLWKPTAWLSIAVPGLLLVPSVAAAGVAIVERVGVSSTVGLVIGGLFGAACGYWVVVESAEEVLAEPQR